MFDIRYHIASLVGVFLALTVGILLGSVIVDKGVLVDQQQALVQSLEARHNDLQDKNEMLNRENAELKQFEAGALSVVNDRLKEKKIAIVLTGDASDEDLNNLKATLDQAGANSAIISMKGFIQGFKERGVRKQLGDFFPDSGLSRQQLQNKVLERIAVQIATPSDGSFLRELAELGLIDLKSVENLPAEQAVFFGGTRVKKGNVNEIDLPLIRFLKQLGLEVVGTEETTVKNSYIDSYLKEVSTVDNIDQISGKIALVYVLLGQDGHFGIKPTAQSMLPSLVLPSQE